MAASNEYLEHHPDICEATTNRIWVLRSLMELMPETLESFWSGHIFPVTEAEYELESSIVFCKLGFYKHAISCLRNVLELGLLSVYWDVEDKAHIDIQQWLKSIESTPFRRAIVKRLGSHPSIKEFDDRQHLFERTAALYGRLSDFSHTKGYRHSSRRLNDHSNVNHFVESSFLKWFGLMQEVVEIVTTFHVLKYPLALQHTPIEEKFGLNGPLGGFIRPHQVEQIRDVISKELLKDLQDISDHDPQAASVVAWVNEQPDITPDEFAAQLEKEDRRSIEMEGFEHWLKNQKKLYASLRKERPEEWKKQLWYFDKLRKWAKENGCLTKQTKDYFGNRVTEDGRLAP